MAKYQRGDKVFEFKGENGLQSPAFLISDGTDDLLALEQFQLIEGNPLSYNNWLDVDKLLQTMTHIGAGWKANYSEIPLIAIGAKHGNACGAGVQVAFNDLAVRKMMLGNTRSIFGGVAMVNFKVTREIAVTMNEAMPGGKVKLDAIVAPEFEEEAIRFLVRPRGACRFLVNPALYFGHDVIDIAPRSRYVRGGKLEQPNYTFVLDFKHPELKVFGERNLQYERDMLLAWAISSTSISNTISIVKNGMLLGNGVGQMDRVEAVELAIKRAIFAGHSALLLGSAASSDSFFPFTDGPKTLADNGIATVFATSGSLKDKEVQNLFLQRGVVLYQLPDAIARGFYH